MNKKRLSGGSIGKNLIGRIEFMIEELKDLQKDLISMEISDGKVLPKLQIIHGVKKGEAR